MAPSGDRFKGNCHQRGLPFCRRCIRVPRAYGQHKAHGSSSRLFSELHVELQHAIARFAEKYCNTHPAAGFWKVLDKPYMKDHVIITFPANVEQALVSGPNLAHLPHGHEFRFPSCVKHQ